MELRQRPGDGETETGAAMAADQLALDLLEGPADAIDLLLRNTDGGELDRVVEQVLEDLVERMRIGDEVQVLSPLDGEGEVLARDLVLGLMHGLGHDEVDRDIGGFQP